MKNYLLIDTKLVAYFHFHRNSDFLLLTNTIAHRLFKLVNQNYLPIFLMDKGQSFRVKIAPEYKAQRKELIKRKGQAYENKVKVFNLEFMKLEDYLRNFGKVLAIEGYEADDLASILLSNLKANEVILFTSDSDWVKFMKNRPNIKSLKYYHLNRDKLMTINEVFNEFDFEDAYYKLIMDCFCGVGKENIKGVKGLGKKTFAKLYDGDLRILIKNIEKEIEKGKLQLPENFNSVQELFDFNYQIFCLIEWFDIDNTTQQEIKKQLKFPMSRNKEKILEDSLELFGRPYSPDAIECSFYKIRS